jgi:hypothetical protein
MKQREKFSPGFRFSVFDGGILVASLLASLWLADVSPIASLVILFVVGHFFLFCNVFRVSRRRELQWAAVFVASASASSLANWPGWLVVFAIAILFAAYTIVRETKDPSYHGVFWRVLNPDLPEWFSANSRGFQGGVARDDRGT